MVLGPPRKGKKFVYCGDSAPCEAVKELARDADVLVHESTFNSDQVGKAEEYKHSTNIQAAQLAKEAGVKNLVLNHISPRYNQEHVEKMLEECREILENTYIASDLQDLVLTSDGELKESREER